MEYTLHICGLSRKLPIVRLSSKLSIASFVVIGDTELVSVCAPQLVKKLPPADLIVTAEAKGIALAYEVSRLLGHREFVVARKNIKPYMADCLADEVRSITTQKVQSLFLDAQDAKKICGARVAILDDVISTGESLAALERLVIRAGGIVCARAALLSEGDATKRSDIIYLEELPVFTDNSSPEYSAD